MKKYFYLTKRKLIMIIVSWLVAVVLHNLIYALLGFEEPVFFTLAIVVIPVYFLISLIYTSIKLWGKR